MFSKTILFAAFASLASAQCAPKGTVLHPNGDTSKCLDVRGAQYANGTPVQM